MPVAIVALFCVLIAQGQRTSAAEVDLLRSWFEAVTAHKPGVVDEPLLVVARRSPDDLQRLQIEVSVLFMLIANPNLTRIRYTPPNSGSFFSVDPRRPQSIAFDGARLEQIRVVAHLVRAAGVDATVKRGAMLHTDIITLQPDLGPIPATPERASSFRVHVDDGRFAGVSASPVHWDLARMLVARTEAPDAEPWVRDWYRASTAFLIGDRDCSTKRLLRLACRHFFAIEPTQVT
jgi:hypothetical protein